MRFLTIPAAHGTVENLAWETSPNPFIADFICGYALPHFMQQRYESVTVIHGHALVLCDPRVPQDLVTPHSLPCG